MKRKTSAVVGLILFLVFVGAVCGLVSVTILHSQRMPEDFLLAKRERASQLYENVRDADLENYYPESAESVMSLYLDGFLLVYGDMIRNEEILADVVLQMQKLYCEEIVENNTEIWEHLNEELAALTEKGIYCISVSQEPPVFLEDNARVCVIGVRVFCNEQYQFKRNYYLELESELWKIVKWESIHE